MAASRPVGRSAALLVAAGIFLSRIVGFVRSRVLAFYFGTSDAADVFNAAFKIPNALQNLLGEGILSASFIPGYVTLSEKEDRHEAQRLAGLVFSLLSVLLFALVALGIAGAPWLVDALALGFEGEKRDATVRLVRVFFPGVGLLILSAWCLGILNSHRRFFLSYASPVVWSTVIIVFLVIGARTGAKGFWHAELAAWGATVGSALQLLVQVPLTLKLLGKFRPNLALKTQAARSVLKAFGPVVFSRGVVQVSGFVDSTVASLLPGGAVAALGYAQQIYMLPISLFGMSVSASELPELARTASAGPELLGALRERLRLASQRIAFFVVPTVAGFIALGDVIVGFLFRTGSFRQNDERYVWAILAGSTVGLLASTLGRLYSSSFYAFKDTKTPFRFSVVRVLVSAVLVLLGALVMPRVLGVSPAWGAVGITAASGFSGWIEFVLLRRALFRKIGEVHFEKRYLLTLAVCALCAAAVGVLVRWSLKDAGHPLVRAMVVLTPFGLVYLAMTVALKIPEAGALTRRLRRRAR